MDPAQCGRYHGSKLRRELRRLLCAGDAMDPECCELRRHSRAGMPDPNRFTQLGPLLIYLKICPCGTNSGNTS